MSAERDVTRIVRSWLEEGVTALPDRVLDAVLDQSPRPPSAEPCGWRGRFLFSNKTSADSRRPRSWSWPSPWVLDSCQSRGPGHRRTQRRCPRSPSSSPIPLPAPHGTWTQARTRFRALRLGHVPDPRRGSPDPRQTCHALTPSPPGLFLIVECRRRSVQPRRGPVPVCYPVDALRPSRPSMALASARYVSSRLHAIGSTPVSRFDPKHLAGSHDEASVRRSLLHVLAHGLGSSSPASITRKSPRSGNRAQLRSDHRIRGRPRHAHALRVPPDIVPPAFAIGRPGGWRGGLPHEEHIKCVLRLAWCGRGPRLTSPLPVWLFRANPHADPNDRSGANRDARPAIQSADPLESGRYQVNASLSPAPTELAVPHS